MKLKRIFALLLSAVLFFTVPGFSVLAGENTETSQAFDENQLVSSISQEQNDAEITVPEESTTEEEPIATEPNCLCLGKIGGMYLVVYNVNGTNKQKNGFVSYNGGC